MDFVIKMRQFIHQISDIVIEQIQYLFLFEADLIDSEIVNVVRR